MIFRSFVSALVVAAIASAAVITTPKHTGTHSSIDHDNNIFVDSSLNLLNTTVKPADNITTVKPADVITTVKPADKITTVKPAAPVPTQAPMISCYCNLPECLVAAGGDGTCSTRLGCYSEVRPIIPGFHDEIVTPTVTESNKTANGSSVSPIISELVKAPTVATTEHATVIRGSFGCLDQLNLVKQSCEEILKSMEAESSEFPTMQMPINTAAPSAADAGVHAFHCCQTERCNGQQSGPAEGSVKSAQAVLIAALNNAIAPHPGVQNSAVGVPWTPAVESSVNNVELFNTKTSVNNVELSNTKTSVNDVKSSNAKTSANNVQLSNAKKNNTEVPELWLGYFSPSGEPNAPPSALKTDTIFKDSSKIDDATPPIIMALPPRLSMLRKREITKDLISDTIFKDASKIDDTTPPILMAGPPKLSVLRKREITQDLTSDTIFKDASKIDDTTPPILMAGPPKLSVLRKREITKDLISDTIFKDASKFDETTPPILMAGPPKLSVLRKRGITQDLISDTIFKDASKIDETTPPILMAGPPKLSVLRKREITKDLISDTIFKDASKIDETTPPILMAGPPKLSVLRKRGITQDETVANVEHVVTKRHDGQRAVPVLKQTIDDQENIPDFDDDIAAEVAAAVVPVKSLEITTQKNTVSSGSSGSFSDSWSPRHRGVPDFIPSPSLKKNITTNSISATRGVNNISNNFNNYADNNSIGTNVIGIICIVVVLCVVGLSLLMIFVLRTIHRKYDIFRNYKGVCSNPNQPCACHGGLTRRRPRTRPSSSHPEAAAAAVNRSASTAPLLPPPNPGHKYRGHGNAGATYNDSIGDTTYVFTKIPVPDHVAPVRVVRR